MNMFYVTQKAIGEIVLRFKRKVTKEQTVKFKVDISCREKSFTHIFLKLIL